MSYPIGKPNVSRMRRPLIVGGQPEWLCSSCRRYLPEACFFSEPRQLSGLKTECRKCHARTAHETRDVEAKRKANREHMRRARIADPEKFRARDRLRRPPGSRARKI